MSRYDKPEFTLRIPVHRVEPVDDDDHGFITPRRARLIRLDIETDRAVAAANAALEPELSAEPAEPPAREHRWRWNGRPKPDAGYRCSACGAESSYPHTSRTCAGRPPERAHATKPCGYYSDAAGRCGASPARRYLVGWRCDDHAPSAPPVPDPARTADGLRRRHELAMRGLRGAAARNAARVLYSLAQVA